MEKKRKEKEKKRAILDSRKEVTSDGGDEEDDGELLPETNDFLANLTMPDHVASDDDSEEDEYNGYV